MVKRLIIESYGDFMKTETLIKKIEMNICRIEQWMHDNDSKSPRLLKVLSSLDALVLDLKKEL